MIANLTPRIRRAGAHHPDFAIYDEAAFKTKRIAALLLRGTADPPAVLGPASPKVPNSWRKRRNGKTVISGLEIRTPLVLGRSGTDRISAIIALRWGISGAFFIDMRLGGVSSKRNLEDLPTRHATINIRVGKRIEFSQLSELLHLTVKWEDRIFNGQLIVRWPTKTSFRINIPSCSPQFCVRNVHETHNASPNF